MGRKRNEKDDLQFGMNYSSSKYKGEQKLLERYGVEGQRQGGRAIEMTGKSYRGSDDVKKDLQKAMANDYDTRRTLEAAAMSGKKKAKKILDSGFKSFSDMENAQNFMEKAAKRHGQGGDFSSTSDYMGLTQSMVERDRRKFTEANDAKYASKADLEGLSVEEQDTGFTYEGPDKEISPEMQAAKERVAAYEGGGGQDDPSPYGASFGADDQQAETSVVADSTDAGGYLNAFKNKLKQERNFKGDL